MLPPDQRPMIKQTKFAYYPVGKPLDKQIKQLKIKEKNKINEDKRGKKIKTLKERDVKDFLDPDQKSITSLFSKDLLNQEAIYDLNNIVEMENKQKKKQNQSKKKKKITIS